MTKGGAAENFEFAVNLRLVEVFGKNAAFGFLLLNEKNEEIERFAFEGESGNFYLSAENASQRFPLPKNFAPENLRQFRFLKLNEKIVLQSEEADSGEISVNENQAKIAVFGRNSAVALEMARLTVL